MYEYNPNNFSEKPEFSIPPVGEYRLRVKDVEPTTSKTGREMVRFEFEVSGQNAVVLYYLVFVADTPEQKRFTDQKIGALLDSFGFDPKEQPKWEAFIGKVGAAKLKHEIYEGETRAVIHYFILRKKQKDMPAWQEKRKANTLTVAADEEVPF